MRPERRESRGKVWGVEALVLTQMLTKTLDTFIWSRDF